MLGHSSAELLVSSRISRRSGSCRIKQHVVHADSERRAAAAAALSSFALDSLDEEEEEEEEDRDDQTASGDDKHVWGGDTCSAEAAAVSPPACSSDPILRMLKEKWAKRSEAPVRHYRASRPGKLTYHSVCLSQ